MESLILSLLIVATGTLHLINLLHYRNLADMFNRMCMNSCTNRKQSLASRGIQWYSNHEELVVAKKISIGTHIGNLIQQAAGRPAAGNIPTSEELRALAESVAPYLYVGKKLICGYVNITNVNSDWSNVLGKDTQSLKAGLSTLFDNFVDLTLIKEAYAACNQKNPEPFSRTVTVHENGKTYTLNLFSIMSKKSRDVLVRNDVYKNFLAF